MGKAIIKRVLYIVFGFVLFLFFSCHRSQGTIVGRWTVEKVNVEFDENRSTPEMVRQYGELEKGNVIEITTDSLLTFVSQGDTLRGRCSLRGDQLFFDGSYFGCYEGGLITTKSMTPMGVVEVIYKKE